MLQIPTAARATPEELSLWLRKTQGLDAQTIRKGSPGGKEGREGKPSPKWNFSGGTASDSWSLEYVPGSESAELKRSSHTLLAAINRLHKGVGGGWVWNRLADSRSEEHTSELQSLMRISYAVFCLKKKKKKKRQRRTQSPV